VDRGTWLRQQQELARGQSGRSAKVASYAEPDDGGRDLRPPSYAEPTSGRPASYAEPAVNAGDDPLYAEAAVNAYASHVAPEAEYATSCDVSSSDYMVQEPASSTAGYLIQTPDGGSRPAYEMIDPDDDEEDCAPVTRHASDWNGHVARRAAGTEDLYTGVGFEPSSSVCGVTDERLVGYLRDPDFVSTLQQDADLAGEIDALEAGSRRNGATLPGKPLVGAYGNIEVTEPLRFVERLRLCVHFPAAAEPAGVLGCCARRGASYDPLRGRCSANTWCSATPLIIRVDPGGKALMSVKAAAAKHFGIAAPLAPPTPPSREHYSALPPPVGSANPASRRRMPLPAELDAAEAAAQSDDDGGGDWANVVYIEQQPATDDNVDC